jgi:hypothetical protein
LSAQAAADELERFAREMDGSTRSKRQIIDDLRLRAAELREHARRRAEQAEATLRAVARVDRARNYGIGDTDG